VNISKAKIIYFFLTNQSIYIKNKRMKYTVESGTKSVDRVLYLMSYDMNKTATENRVFEQTNNQKSSFFTQQPPSSGKSPIGLIPKKIGSKPLPYVNTKKYLSSIWTNWNHETSSKVEIGLTLLGGALMMTGVGAPLGGALILGGTALGVADAIKYYDEGNPYMGTMMMALQLIPGGELAGILGKGTPKIAAKFPKFAGVLEKVLKNEVLTDVEGKIFKEVSEQFNKHLPEITNLIKKNSLRALSIKLKREKTKTVLRYFINLLRFGSKIGFNLIGKMVIKVGRVAITVDQLWTLLSTPQNMGMKMRNKEEFSKIFDKLYDGRLTQAVKDNLWIVWQQIQGKEINEEINDELIKNIIDKNSEDIDTMDFESFESELLEKDTLPNRWSKIQSVDTKKKLPK
jgi:hypothetical protein